MPYAHVPKFLDTSAYFYAISIGIDSKYTYVNPNYDRNFGLGKATLKGQHFSVTLHPDDISICEQVGQQCFEDTKRLYPATLRKHDGKGGFITTQWEMQGILDEHGAPQSIFCIGYNITEFLDTRAKLDLAALQLDEISFIQSHGVRKPLANIMAIAGLIGVAEDMEEVRLLTSMLNQSANELDLIIREISNK
ncbi:PAS domain S-box-containing protein [Mucilaginibacter oryzae]|uniref:PAS domain S-box-containing protein n=1 Tax=Mucilaginibacter oryzae TaxID=468058 RepID=A0A316HVY3_9SPHI|nr:PAS domain S-box protein [Mucilaginibacter oryzae]PWK79132.1 PAS domain S-box-containing protein [Mucilaginibacter oryzae]